MEIEPPSAPVSPHARGLNEDPDLQRVRASHWMPRWATEAAHRLLLLLLCSAYLQGGFNKLNDFDGAIAEMHHFGLTPAIPLATAVIVLEIGGSLMILFGWYRWLGAMALAGFTLLASFVANPFWALEPAARGMVENAFFEHIGLCGGLLLVAWHELRKYHVH